MSLALASAVPAAVAALAAAPTAPRLSAMLLAASAAAALTGAGADESDSVDGGGGRGLAALVGVAAAGGGDLAGAAVVAAALRPGGRSGGTLAAAPSLCSTTVAELAAAAADDLAAVAAAAVGTCIYARALADAADDDLDRFRAALDGATTPSAGPCGRRWCPNTVASRAAAAVEVATAAAAAVTAARWRVSAAVGRVAWQAGPCHCPRRRPSRWSPAVKGGAAASRPPPRSRLPRPPVVAAFPPRDAPVAPPRRASAQRPSRQAGGTRWTAAPAAATPPATAAAIYDRDCPSTAARQPRRPQPRRGGGSARGVTAAPAGPTSCSTAAVRTAVRSRPSGTRRSCLPDVHVADGMGRAKRDRRSGRGSARYVFRDGILVSSTGRTQSSAGQGRAVGGRRRCRSSGWPPRWARTRLLQKQRAAPSSVPCPSETCRDRLGVSAAAARRPPPLRLSPLPLVSRDPRAARPSLRQLRRRRRQQGGEECGALDPCVAPRGRSIVHCCAVPRR